ncbi:hypothetical protein DPMN_180075 [Dreissena polymorpha]|uniref:Uncharacterized protein n=1 Tax=Dreissena polymorpha TaxID=45954 RepID=A0A9D4EF72_DREPO|nr:hypothetical protein DPMN_180075 [Dreissena polymorpha]
MFGKDTAYGYLVAKSTTTRIYIFFRSVNGSNYVDGNSLESCINPKYLTKWHLRNMSLLV